MTEEFPAPIVSSSRSNPQLDEVVAIGEAFRHFSYDRAKELAVSVRVVKIFLPGMRHKIILVGETMRPKPRQRLVASNILRPGALGHCGEELHGAGLSAPQGLLQEGGTSQHL